MPLVPLTRRTFLGSIASAALAGPAAAAPAVLTRPDPVERRSAAAGGLRKLDHLQRRQRSGRARVVRRSDARVLRGRRTHDRFLADVRLLAAGDRRRLEEDRRRAGVLRRQGVDLIRRARAGADRNLAQLLGRAEVRSAAGAQPALLGGAPAHARRHEGRRPGALHRHHDVGRPPPRRLREDHARARARLRAALLQHPRPRGGEPHPAARARARHRGDHQSPVPRGRSDQEDRPQTAAAVRRRDRRAQAGRSSF